MTSAVYKTKLKGIQKELGRLIGIAKKQAVREDPPIHPAPGKWMKP
jgi:hypothetical protein